MKKTKLALPPDFPDWPRPELDLGSNVWAAFGTSQGSKVRTHVLTVHRCAASETGWRTGSLGLDLPENKDTARPRWAVQSMDPLSITPSVQHNCGCPLSHGFITNGKWVIA
jgi:hypothetical protein